VSYVLVLTTGAILLLLMVLTYRRATNAMEVQKDVQMCLDYGEKEDAILRSIVAITPNRAIRAMQHHSNSSDEMRNPLRWQNIFTDALDQANARTAIPNEVRTALRIASLRSGNTGDSTLGTPSVIFKAISPESGYVSVGVNRSLTGCPPALTASTSTRELDLVYPIITSDKLYGALAQSRVGLPVETYPNFNLLTYPRINFGYSRPGDPFVARRNWWAFSMDVSAQDAELTRLVRPGRDFVLSIYEVPSQLAISASSYLSFGQYASGDAWQNVTIGGGVFAGKALVEGTTAFVALASRRGMTLSRNATLGGQSFSSNPFTPGLRETYQLTQGDFFPASLASESGRVVFVPISRGADYFDRFAHSEESDVLSPSTWNNYSVGALQCAMRLDVTEVASETNPMPTRMQFSYLKGGVRQELSLSLSTGAATGLPAGYLFACNQTETYDFGTAVVDVAFGANGIYAYKKGVTGSVTFNVPTFGNPVPGVVKTGYFRPSYPFGPEEVKTLASGQICLKLYPERFASFLASLHADSTTVNHSLVVNVDYTRAWLTKPRIPCTDLDYGLILEECTNLSTFTRGFSLVTNLRTYFGSNFNLVATTPPSGYTPSGLYYPPCSVFTPEKRYGVDVDPLAVNLRGQLGSLADETNTTPVRPLDSRSPGGNPISASGITVNLNPIIHPAELPPITMMNWLVVLEEMRKEFVNY
jgi:hypothetical protein